MPITVLSGLPGAGKSSRLIELVNKAIDQDRPVATFACSDSPWLASLEHIQVRRQLICRRPGLTCPLNHFVSAADGAAILATLPAGTLAAFDETYWFGTEIVPHWIAASERGLDLLIVWPSRAQLKQLDGYAYTEITLTIPCQRCGKADASDFVYLPDREEVLCICDGCNQELADRARDSIRSHLLEVSSTHGERTLVQPLPLEEYADWRIVGADAAARLKMMSRIFHAMRMFKGRPRPRPTYLDLGCGTGYFCHHLRQLGFYYVEGVDPSEHAIAVAKLLDSFFLRDNNVYKHADPCTYLRETEDQLVDVISALQVSDWLGSAGAAQEQATCLERLFAKTKQICFLAPGYATQATGQGDNAEAITGPWLVEAMQESGQFAKILLFKATTKRLQTDLVVGLKTPPDHQVDEVVERLGAHIQYPKLIPRIRRLVNTVVPADATVIIASKGDEELMKLGKRQTWHFPQSEEGVYAGYHPADSTEAIAHLEALRAKGGEFLLFPHTALWWLDFYTEFNDYLTRHYRVVARHDEVCVIFALRDAHADQEG